MKRITPLRVIFVGPSLGSSRPELVHSEYRPPAKRGDIAQAVEEGAGVIGLIDGVFHQNLAVTPAEVRAAAHQGVHLFGGASMGALRACECPDSMQGIGDIWSAFVRGEITDDDEVAVTFLPYTFETVAYPLVQLREACRLAEARHPNMASSLDQLIEIVRGEPFQERTLEMIRRAAQPLLGTLVPWSEMAAWLSAERFDVKRRDALKVVAAVESARNQAPGE